jgi:hypothetical protein
MDGYDAGLIDDEYPYCSVAAASERPESIT